MTSNPLTIAGETVGPEDWPESPYFEFDHGLDEKWRFNFPDPLIPVKRGEFPELEPTTDFEFYSAPVRIESCKPHELVIVAAVARCYFLDKAAEERQIAAKYEQDGAYFGDKFGGMETANYKAWLGAVDKARRYLASAAKWARIGRSSTK